MRNFQLTLVRFNWHLVVWFHSIRSSFYIPLLYWSHSSSPVKSGNFILEWHAWHLFMLPNVCQPVIPKNSNLSNLWFYWNNPELRKFSSHTFFSSNLLFFGVASDLRFVLRTCRSCLVLYEVVGKILTATNVDTRGWLELSYRLPHWDKTILLVISSVSLW